MVITHILDSCHHVDCFLSFALKTKCERYWLEELNKPLELSVRGFTVTVTRKKDYADYEIRDMTIRYVSVQSRRCTCIKLCVLDNVTTMHALTCSH